MLLEQQSRSKDIVLREVSVAGVTESRSKDVVLREVSVAGVTV